MLGIDIGFFIAAALALQILTPDKAAGMRMASLVYFRFACHGILWLYALSRLLLETLLAWIGCVLRYVAMLNISEGTAVLAAM